MDGLVEFLVRDKGFKCVSDIVCYCYMNSNEWNLQRGSRA